MHNLISKKVSSLSREKNTLWHSFLQDKVSSPRAFCSVQFSQYGPFPLTNYLLLTRVICNMRNKYWRYFHFIKIVLPLNPLYSAIYSSWALCTVQLTQVVPSAKIRYSILNIVLHIWVQWAQSKDLDAQWYWKHTKTIKMLHNLVFINNFFSLGRGKTTLRQRFLQGKLSSARAFCTVQFSPLEPFALIISLLDPIFHQNGLQ